MAYVYSDISIFKCPHCKRKINIHESQDLSTRLTRKKCFSCPVCHEPIRWWRPPQYLFAVGLLIALAALGCLLIPSIDPVIAGPIMLGGFVLSGIAMMAQRLVECDKPLVMRSRLKS